MDLGPYASALAAFFNTIGTWRGLEKQRDAEKKTAEVQAGAVAAKEQAAKDKFNTALAKGDIKEIRNELAE